MARPAGGYAPHWSGWTSNINGCPPSDQDAARMDTEEASRSQEQVQVDANLRVAREAEERARGDLEAIDGSDIALNARDAMERKVCCVIA